ncbi:hypothetical protein X275_00115 [Marinitoga sp. 1197]|nr:hypothetical protein X275_00115 [Marinitoga sp. 1197]
MLKNFFNFMNFFFFNLFTKMRKKAYLIDIFLNESKKILK